jgi:circadian clock protein KaiB
LKSRSKYKFRLYIAGATQNSLKASDNLATYCSQHLLDPHDIELIDVLTDPESALADKVFMTPTLLRMTPKPLLRIVGTLSDARNLSQVLNKASAVA